MNNKKTKTYSVRVEPSLMNKVHQYLDISKANGSKISKTKFFNDLLEEFFYNKLLEKGFLELETPYYINTTELMEKRVVNAATEKPSSDLKNQMIIFKVPNNLDSWNNKYKTFCSEKPSHHEGIKPILALFQLNKRTDTIKIIYHVFKINYHPEDNKETSLEVSILSPEEVEIFLNQYPEEIAEELLIEFKQLEKDVDENLASGLTPFEVFKKYNDPSFARMLHYNQNINNTANLLSSIANNFFDVITEASIESNKIYEDFTKDLEEKGRDNFTLEDVEKYENRIIENKLNMVKGLRNYDTNLNIRDSKTLKKANKILEENPDNPIFEMIDSINEYLTEVNNSEEPIPTEEVQKTISNKLTEIAFNVKEDSNISPEFILKLFEGTDLNENVLDIFSIMANAESEEEYIKEVNKLAEKLNLNI